MAPPTIAPPINPAATPGPHHPFPACAGDAVEAASVATQPVPSVSSSWQSLSQTPESLVPTKVPVHLERPPHLATDRGHIVSHCAMASWRKRNPQAPA